MSRDLHIEHIFLINDLEANGYGIAELRLDQIYTLSEGDNSQLGNRGLIAAGTGLGEGLLIWDGKTMFPWHLKAAMVILGRTMILRLTCCDTCDPIQK